MRPKIAAQVLEALERMVADLARVGGVERCEVRFSRRQAMAVAGISLTQLQLHLGRLVDHELVILHRQTHGIGFLYELVWSGEGRDGKPFLPGLIDVDSLRDATTNGTLSGVKAGGVGGVTPRNRAEIGDESAGAQVPFGEDESAPEPENSTLPVEIESRPYAQAAE
jgi:hypothetical protein